MDRSWYRVALRGVSRASLAGSLFPISTVLGVMLLTSSPAMAQSVCNQTGGAAPTASGGSAFACGDGASAGGGTSTAFGTDANAAGNNSTAVGSLASSAGEFSTAIGRSATSSGEASTALGFNSVASGANAMAFGANAAASAENAVALGTGSIADEANSVSLGAAGAERKVTNMAAGTNATDGVNVSQLNDTAATTLASANQYTDEQADATLTEANTYADQVAGDTLTAANDYTDQQVNQIGGMASGAAAALEQFRAEANDRFAGIDSRLNAMDDSLRTMDKRISRQAAMTAAFVQSSGMPDVGKNYLGAGVGWSEGENAFAATFRRRFTEHFTASVGAASSGSETSVGLGGGITW